MNKIQDDLKFRVGYFSLLSIYGSSVERLKCILLSFLQKWKIHGTIPINP